MFDINKISYDHNSGMHICICPCTSPYDAEYLVAKYNGISRMLSASGNMYYRGSDAYIEAYLYNDVAKIASYINANYFMPPLDVYIFYGNSQKSLASRWCVGFNYPQEQVNNLINFLNNGQKTVIADKDPQSWKDEHGSSYSIIMLTGVMEHELSEECKKRVNLCLDVIADTTARRINPLLVQ